MSTETVTKDEKYYRIDGDCIAQVENILFNVSEWLRFVNFRSSDPKIHRYHLAESDNSSVFHTMFSLPSGTLPSEGQHDQNPILLQGDTPAQFRAFLYFSYSKYGTAFVAEHVY